MGYFKRKLDRARARREARELYDAGLAEGSWTAAVQAAPGRHKARFLRFCIVERHPRTHHRYGVFTGASMVAESGRLEESERELLEDELHWFAEHLPAPDLDRYDLVFLFKSDAGQCTRRIWNLVRIVAAGGWAVEMQVLERPGRIMYEDDYQVAVIPWSGTGL